jgi:inhibitor of cysteine peptidase
MIGTMLLLCTSMGRIPIKGKRRARMFTKLSLSIVSILLLISLTGCGGTSATETPSSSAGDAQIEASETCSETGSANNYQMLPVISGKVASLDLDASADGSTQQLKLGEVMSITLESNPSTGYSWFATVSNPDVLSQMGEPEYIEPTQSSSTMIVGAAGTETFMFQGTASGSAIITLDYKRGWETGVAPEKTITITVEVK